MKRRIGAAVAVALIAASSASAASGHSAELPIVTSFYRQFVPATLLVPRGTGLRLVQLDPLEAHDLTSLGFRPDGARQFATSRSHGFGGTEAVHGVAELGPGEYDFTCLLHPQMYGVLRVV